MRSSWRTLCPLITIATNGQKNAKIFWKNGKKMVDDARAVVLSRIHLMCIMFMAYQKEFTKFYAPIAMLIYMIIENWRRRGGHKFIYVIFAGTNLEDGSKTNMDEML